MSGSSQADIIHCKQWGQGTEGRCGQERWEPGLLCPVSLWRPLTPASSRVLLSPLEREKVTRGTLSKQNALQAFVALGREAHWRSLPGLPSVGKSPSGLAEFLERRNEMKLRKTVPQITLQ